MLAAFGFLFQTILREPVPENILGAKFQFLEFARQKVLFDVRRSPVENPTRLEGM